MIPRPASTVVLVRETRQDIETLLLLRNSALAFNGGYWVFPGGKIEAEDYPCPDAHEYEAARRAVVRETREEAGVEISLQDLIHIAHWTTPPGHPRRYSTWFFVCALQESVAVQVDDSEILDHRWLSPNKALAEHHAGALRLPLPTSKTLEMLQHYRSLQELAEALRTGQVHVFPPDSEFYQPPVAS